MILRITIFLLGILAGNSLLAQDQRVQKLSISKNGRYFQTADGSPFFWLGDTGWLLFAKLTREEAIHYLDTRQKQGFNVIQVMMLHDLQSAKNAYGDSALYNHDVSRPRVTKGNRSDDPAAYDYWDHVDFIIDEAAKRGIYMALVPVWGSNVKGGHVTVEQGRKYARFLTSRYRERGNIIWLNGGDIKGGDGMDVWKAIGEVLHSEDGNHLVTFHPRGRTSSSEWFHNESWLDFNMFQSGHRTYAQDTSSGEANHFGEDNWRYVARDFALTPVKPTIDGEPSYENIPHGLHDSMQPRWTDADLRRYAYWSVFAGAAGFTYGENAIMQFHTAGDKDANFGVNNHWKATIHAPGANQMQHLRTLMLSRKNYFDRVPAQEILAGNTGQQYNYLLATRGPGYAMVYSYTGKNFSVDLSKLGFTPSTVSWFSPAMGVTTSQQLGSGSKMLWVDPPGEPAASNDWVLIIE